MGSEDRTPLPSDAPISGTGQPRAFALNETTTCAGIEVTLLALVVVDELVRVSGIVRVRRPVDLGPSSVPTLSIRALDEAPLLALGAHLLTQGPGAVWVSWLYRRPVQIPGRYEARIDRIDLGIRGGRRPPEAVAGPWVFAFGVATPGPPLRLISRVD